MEEEKTKEVLDFLLNSYRAKLAVHDVTDGCPFDFSSFLTTWKCQSWLQLKINMHKTLEPLVQQGLFDSILPYLTSSIFQVVFGRDELPGTVVTHSALTETKNDATVAGNEVSLEKQTVSTNSHSSKKKLEKAKEKESEDCEILIHVCDESKGVKEDFNCLQSILTREMGYFSRVTVKGQRLRDMDISVHCDISVFEWLMKWICFRNGETVLDKPTLESCNVIGILVSADFLQMPDLVIECLQYTFENIGQIINVSPNLGCLNESLTARLARFFDNAEVERRIQKLDKSDRITSRLYSQMIVSLNEPEPDMDRGHYASTATMFKCDTCGQLLINDVASKMPCSSMRFDCRGRIYANHTKDPTWTLGAFIKDLKKEVKTWRKVYWRLWASVHFFSCEKCHIYFPAKFLNGCRFHPRPIQLSTGARSERKERNFGKSPSMQKNNYEGSTTPVRNAHDDIVPSDMVLPYGHYPCCKQAAYRSSPLPFVKGCESRDHSVDNYSKDNPTLKTMLTFRDLIVYANNNAMKNEMDWGGIIEMTTVEKLAKEETIHIRNPSIDLLLLPSKLRTSTFSSDSVSSEDEVCLQTERKETYSSTYGKIFDSWAWNTELTTRYNQDMQREREEKLMVDLAVLLSQRISLETSVGFPPSKLGYLSRRSIKNVGGSYVKLEQTWRDDISHTRSHRNAKNGKILQQTNGRVQNNHFFE